MVTVVQLHPQNSAAALGPLAEGLAAAEQALLGRALEFAEPMYAGQLLSTGEPTWSHALGLAANLASIGLDAPGRAAGVLFAAPKHLGGVDALRERFGEEIAGLAAGVEKLYQLRVATRGNPHEQNEVLRKMVLGMVEDVRVVLIRLASRTQTLRYFSKNPSDERTAYARETLDIYSPLANRLGVWQLKWELEDLSFRYLEPEVYKRVAQMLDERRVERQQYIARTIATLARELEEAGVKAEITGRPKHIYSIWNKMRSKSLDFSEVYDVRAARIIVPSVKDCYTALGVVHNLWQPIPKEFDDYISRPKGNLYQSLHTAVVGPAERSKCRSAPRRCTARRSSASPRTGATRSQASLRGAKAPSSRRSPGCASCWRGATRLPTGRKIPSKPGWTKRFTSSRRRARSSTCRRARRRSTSLTRCTPTSVTAAAGPGSTAASRPSTRRWRAARASRSSPRSPAARRATGSAPSAASSKARARARKSGSGSTPRR